MVREKAGGKTRLRAEAAGVTVSLPVTLLPKRMPLHFEARAQSSAWRWLERLVLDLRFALRLARRNILVTTLAALTLAIGIGANTIVFSLVEAAVLRPLPYRDPQRLFMLWTVEGKSQRAHNSSYADVRDWRQQSQSFQAIAAFRGNALSLTGGSEPERVDAVNVTPDFFQVVGAQPILGRAFVNGEDNERVAVLDHRLWTRRFGADPRILGQRIQLDGRAYTVIGILGPGFHFVPRYFVGDPLLFTPLAPYAGRTNYSLRVIGRLRPGASQPQARAELSAIESRIAQASAGAIDARQGVRIEPLDHYAVADAPQTALLLLGAVSFVLLIACTNVANLLLSQGAARRREFGVRIAIGAPRSRLIRQLLTESILLAGLGGGLGILFARWGLPLLLAIAPQSTALLMRVRDNGVQLNSTVLAFTAAISVLAACAFGILPALKSTQPAAGSTRSFRGGRVRGGLIALEVALCFVLLAGAGLMMKSLTRLLAVDLGVRTEHILTLFASLPSARYPDGPAQTTFFEHTLERVATLPGVLSAGAIENLPLTREYRSNSFDIEGTPPTTGNAAFHAVGAGYFETMGIPLIRGRLFTASDGAGSLDVGVVSRAMARQYWPGEDPIGRTILTPRPIHDQTAEGMRLRFVKAPVEIVGVVGDVRHFGFDSDPLPELYLPYAQDPRSEMNLVVRTAADPASLVPLVKKEIWHIDSDLPVTDIKTMDQWVSADTAPRRFILLLIGVFALCAVALAAAGIYGVVSYSVTQRTQEIGIRMALGAGRRGLLWWVLRQTVVWLALGIATGGAGALAVTRVLRTYLFHVPANDPAVFALVGSFLAVIAVAAHALPARRAMKVNPLEALRCE